MLFRVGQGLAPGVDLSLRLPQVAFEHLPTPGEFLDMSPGAL
jgi:hypothetical protein